jgi:hypothetical protein
MNYGRDDHGITRRERLAPAPGAETQKDWQGANEAKTEKLKQHSLQRDARARGLELRHSSYGYALIDAARKPLDGRNDMSLKEIESTLAQL